MSSTSVQEAIAAEFSSSVFRHRRQLGLSQEELARLAGLHRTEIGLLERGFRLPRLDTLVKLAAALSCSLDDLVVRISWEMPTESTGRFRVGVERFGAFADATAKAGSDGGQ